MDALSETITQRIIIDRCPLCGNEAHEPLASFAELTWVRCSCSLIYKRKETAYETEKEFYDGGYFKPNERNGKNYSRRTRHRVGKSTNQILDTLNHVRRGPVLDVGCSMGYTLMAARKLGLDAAGLDISEYAVNTCRNLGFRAEQGSLEHMPFVDQSFQIIVMKHVFEHTPNPRAALEEIKRLLRPGGGLFIAVPHAGYHKAVKKPSSSRFYKPEGGGREHFVYYTPETLTTLLEGYGFRVKKIHPHLFHKEASVLKQTAELTLAPLRFAWESMLTGLSFRKEFWLIAALD